MQHLDNSRLKCKLCDKVLNDDGACVVRVPDIIFKNHYVHHYKWACYDLPAKYEVAFIGKYKIFNYKKFSIVQFRRNNSDSTERIELQNIKLDLTALYKLSAHELDAKIKLYVGLT